MDLSRTVGWFTACSRCGWRLGAGAVPASLEGGQGAASRVPATGHRLRAPAPPRRPRRGGESCPAARPGRLQLPRPARPRPRGFGLALAAESTGPSQSRGGGAATSSTSTRHPRRPSPSGWTYGRDRHERATIERLAAAFIDSLRALIAHCRPPKRAGTRRRISLWPAWTSSPWLGSWQGSEHRGRLSAVPSAGRTAVPHAVRVGVGSVFRAGRLHARG